MEKNIKDFLFSLPEENREKVRLFIIELLKSLKQEPLDGKNAIKFQDQLRVKFWNEDMQKFNDVIREKIREL